MTNERRTRKARQQEAEPPEAARQSAELAAFRRMLIASEGTFSLSFCVYNVVHLRDELIDALTSELAGIAVIRLPAGTPDAFRFVQQQQPHNDAAVFVLDLEQSLEEGALRALNASRELWERFPCPVVFWLAEHAAALIAEKAADFWRYRSHTFEFTTRPVTTRDLQRERFPGYEMILGMPYEEKRFRRAELERRIAEAGSPPSKKMLPHILSWLYELAELHEIFNDWTKAEEVKREAVTLCERAYGPESRELAGALNNLATLLQATNRLSEAEPLLRRALAIDETSFGGDHPNVAAALNNLALLLKDTNRLSEAEPLMRRSVTVAEAAFGNDHPEVATRLNNLVPRPD